MPAIEQALAARGLVLPPPMRTPPGLVLPFAFVRVLGRRALVSGHGPLAADGTPAPPLGKLGRELTVEQGRSAAGMAELPFDIPVEIEAELELGA
jgi:hypothetical protein